MEDNLASEFCQLSLNALAGTAQGEALVVRALVQNKVMLILVDSGSSHSFINQQFVQLLNIPTLPMPAQQVRLANGDTLTTNTWVPKLEWWSNGYTVQTNMKVLQMPAYDAILGYDWLKANSPMQCNWAEKTLQFQHKDQQVTLQGIRPVDTTIPEVSITQVRKWVHGNDVWAMAVVEEVPTAHTIEQNTVIQQLLQQYQDVFQEPQHLPPHRFYDHHNPLLPGSAPVNSKPYKYSPHHKDEIERQVKQLLTAGLITPSCSPFASPVLLVLKKVGSWRFCVDYRKLNDITVRMKQEDEFKTAFKTHQGHYQFWVMPFGLTNAPATFQCIMNEILAPFLRKFVMVFLDDILIYSLDFETHIHHLTLVLDKLRENQLFMKASKCSFAQTKLEYLGHIISDKGVATDPSKIEAMITWAVPTTVTALRGFWG